MTTEETKHYLALGGEMHGKVISDLSDEYQPLEHMAATGNGPFRHYHVACHDTYDRSNTLRDIEAHGFRPHRVE
ncbi:hypothetical protein [Escherichia coli]|uniref:hypothetical protein n=1 Tax=Escherichia coli TaxID=562 RepID=UPI0007084BBB|nr:hypothetical protein [Escherichia coli]KQJ07433.1 hypothetical protein AM264_03500 [Escherichia coli]MCI5011528.1 hypothetical protein [Escherichia coli]OJP98039.1 hypothetical protein BK352_09915 [Escherichia coli]